MTVESAGLPTIAVFLLYDRFRDDVAGTSAAAFRAARDRHVAWSTWCAFALSPVVRRRIARVVLVLYPAMLLLCVVVTGSHGILDAAGRWVILALDTQAVRVERLSGGLGRTEVLHQSVMGHKTPEP